MKIKIRKFINKWAPCLAFEEELEDLLQEEKEKLLKFTEWIYDISDWYFIGDLWCKDGYKDRTTEELFMYYLLEEKRNRHN